MWYNISALNFLGGATMARKIYTREELLEAWKKQEKKVKEENDRKLLLTTKCCRNCANSFYRYVPPTGRFTEPSEFCGCHQKVAMVNPNGVCEKFSLR